MEEMEVAKLPNSSGNLIFKVKSFDNEEIFEIDEQAAFQSQLLRQMATDLSARENSKLLDEPLVLSNVDTWTLRKILSWCNEHRLDIYRAPAPTEDPTIKLTQEEEQFLNLSSHKLLSLFQAASYMNIPGLVDCLSQKIANMTAGKTVNEIREVFGIANDFTEEEENKLEQRFSWIDSFGS